MGRSEPSESERLWREAVREAAPPSLWGWLLFADVALGPSVEVDVADEVALQLLDDGRVGERLSAALTRRLGHEVRVAFRLGGTPATLDPLPPPPVAPRAVGPLWRSPRPVRGRPIPLAEVGVGSAVVEGTVFRGEVRALRSGGRLAVFDISDGTDALRVKWFARGNESLPAPVAGQRLRARGEVQMDRVERMEVLVARELELHPPPERPVGAPRYEVHLHTQMSAMDGLIDVERLCREAQARGIAGFVVTDHGVVQAYPVAYDAARAHGVELRYGIEAYVVDEDPVVWGTPPERLDRYVALDFETTSLSPRTGEVIEIGAVRFEGGRPTGRFTTLVRPEGELPADVVALTGIGPGDLQTAPVLDDVLDAFLAFLGDDPVVAHNAAFERGYLAALLRRRGRTLTVPIIDTLAMGRRLHPGLRGHRLPDLARAEGVPQTSHHRAADDALVAGQLLAKWLERDDVRADGFAAGAASHLVGRPYHVLGIVVDEDGLEALYRLVSESHLETFHRVPRIPRARLAQPGLLWGAPACYDGELLEAYWRGEDEEVLVALARRYDFVEIPTPGRLLAAADPGLRLDAAGARAAVATLERVARRAGVLAVFGSDAHHLDPEEGILRRIAARAQGQDHAPPLPLPTTDEALAELAGVVPDPAAIVLENPRRLFQRTKSFPPVPDGLHTPELPEAEERVREDALARARALYPEPWPPEVAERLERELDAILGHGFAVVYHAARLLVEASRADGFAVGSRGSVGSSFVAFLLGITEVNPLPPHYLCPGCTVEFATGAASGVDLPPRDCPACGRPFLRDGHDIPFETFLGFEGDKVPDIDLNFAGAEQPRIHRKAEEIFGRECVFRAGTIATVAERTAFGLVKGYLRDEGRTVRELEVERLAAGLVGVKRTTGQHPGGVMIVPRHLDVHRFTPVQRPADDPTAEQITTHFDYDAISSRLLKLDILGHDDPTILRLLHEMTGVDPLTVPLDDPATLSLFSGLDALGVGPEMAGAEVGTLGLPEFGTRFVRTMLEVTRPKRFSELVRISGLSHGTDVWTNNARDLIEGGVATLDEVIATRDDILLYLVQKGVEKRHAFKIMEQVRKGKGLTPEDEAAMRAAGVPGWYIESCKKILYMFPKAHAVAYVTMAVRIAYFKVHHPLAFYASYFSVRAEEFDLDHAYLDFAELDARIRTLSEGGRERTAKDRALLTHLEVAREMRARGIRFLPLSLERSRALEFWPEADGIRPPFRAVPGLGAAGALALAEARDAGPFRSLADLRQRGRVTKTALEAMARYGALAGLNATDQLTLFD
jgi:DNA polymerase-3 subunit alpha (Gram-positive type)